MDISASKDLATKLAIGSFTIGTIIFVLGLLFSNHTEFLLLAVFYILAAIVANSIYLLVLAYLFIIHPYERQEIAIRMLLIVTNIPITIIYIYLVSEYGLHSPF